MRTLISEGIEIFIIVEGCSYRSPYRRILQNPFLAGVFLSVGHRIFPYTSFLVIHARNVLVLSALTRQLYLVSLATRVASNPNINNVVPVNLCMDLSLWD